ncbi:MAG: hypothetical protein IIC74_09780 [Bacteroidetes bacterium]|nr:hypothetical protein [Bacteroidota bacterium]
MKKLIFLFLTSIILFNCENESVDIQATLPPCDNGTFVGDVVLNSQQEVDDFGAMCYSKIEGKLIIGASWVENDISDLSSLSSITQVSKKMRISAFYLESLNGLNNITTVGGLWVLDSFYLKNLDGLESLEQVGNLIQDGYIGYAEDMQIVRCSSLISIKGLSNLKYVEGLFMQGNTELISLDGLENLQTVITYNNYLGVSIGLSNCIDGFQCIPNLKLNNLCALQNLFTDGIYDEDFVTIKWNAYNPTIQDIIDGNCSQ